MANFNLNKVILGGRVVAENSESSMELRLKLNSNPDFTASILVACARAAYRMHKEGMSGCKTVFDIPPIYLHEKSRDEIIRW